MNEQINFYDPCKNTDPSASYEWSYVVTFSQIWHIPLIIWKTMGIIAMILLAAFLILLFFFGHFSWDFVLEFISYLVFFGGCFAVLMGFIFLLIGIFTRGKMVYHLRISPEEICLVQSTKEQKRNETIGRISIVTGIVTGNYGNTFIGSTMLSGDINRLPYNSILRIRLYRRWNMINLTRGFGMFPVYVMPEDYDFVKDYIIAHLPEKKRKRYEEKWK